MDHRSDFVSKRLAALYPETPIPLDHTDAYTLLIAVLLSAQCTDKRVNLTTPALFALADNPANMAQLSVEQINAIVRAGAAEGASDPSAVRDPAGRTRGPGAAIV